MPYAASMLALSNVKKLYDGRSSDSASLHENVDLLIDGERIHALEPHRPDRPTTPEDEVVDASTWTVTPGLIDCHGHVTVLGMSGSFTSSPSKTSTSNSACQLSASPWTSPV